MSHQNEEPEKEPMKAEPEPQRSQPKEGSPGGAKPLPERLPRPTVWPVTMALGATLLAFGVLTSWIISLAGMVLFFLAAGGWFKDLRDEQLQ